MKLPIDTAKSIQAAEDLDNRLPSPPSKLIEGTWTNVCPRCKVPINPYPWYCIACYWTPGEDSSDCCIHIHNVVVDEKDKTQAEYPVTNDEITSAKAVSVNQRSKKEAELAKLSLAVKPK